MIIKGCKQEQQTAQSCCGLSECHCPRTFRCSPAQLTFCCECFLVILFLAHFDFTVILFQIILLQFILLTYIHFLEVCWVSNTQHLCLLVEWGRVGRPFYWCIWMYHFFSQWKYIFCFRHSFMIMWSFKIILNNIT